MTRKLLNIERPLAALLHNQDSYATDQYYDLYQKFEFEVNSISSFLVILNFQ